MFALQRRNGCDKVLKFDVLSGVYESYRIGHCSSRFEEGGSLTLRRPGLYFGCMLRGSGGTMRRSRSSDGSVHSLWLIIGELILEVGQELPSRPYMFP